MNTQKKELAVAALENGTVIDRIPSEHLFKVVALLGLDKFTNSITIGNNLKSKKIGKKGIIKLADTFFQEGEINRIALLAPNAKINEIHDYQVTVKKQVTLPDVLVGVVKCDNPKCITNNEPMDTLFEVIDKEKVELKCHYCERIIEKERIEIR